MTNVDFHQSRLSNSDCCNLLFKCVLCAHTRVCLCVRLLVPSDGYNRFWPPQCEWLTQNSCSMWTTQWNATRAIVPSHPTPCHTEKTLALHMWSMWLATRKAMYYSIRPPVFDKQSPQHIYQVSEQWQLRFNVMQDRAANFVKLKIKYRLLTWQPLCSFSPK